MQMVQRAPRMRKLEALNILVKGTWDRQGWILLRAYSLAGGGRYKGETTLGEGLEAL